MTRRSTYHAPTSVLGFLMKAVLLLLLIWSAWQTWQFVNWLFPDDELGFRILALISFDIMAFLWLSVCVFYRFQHHQSKTWVNIAAGVTGTLSVAASFLYLSIQGFFRFHITPSPDWYDVGIAASLIALFANILFLLRIVTWEEEAKREQEVSHARYVRRKTRVTAQLPQVTLSNVTALPPPKSNGNAPLTPAQKQQRYRDRKRGFLP